MLGLFMILPVFALYAEELEGVTPALVGLALGAYGITQAFLQIPAGLLSDRIGRKPVIIGGLVLFGLGSVLAAVADSIWLIILGRAVQGAGAIAAAVMALSADLTREQHRIKAMALIGMSIGLSFAAAMILGPVLELWVGVPGIFWITALLAVFGIFVVVFLVPQPAVSQVHREAEPVPAQFARVLRNAGLLRLDFGIFVLHAIITASFVVLPLALRDSAGLELARHWQVYLGVLVVSVILMLPLMFMAGRRERTRGVFLFAIGLLGTALAALYFVPLSLVSLVGLLVAFFVAFNLLEAMLPSLVSRVAPPDCRGTALGFYSSSQFFGTFVGGSLGGIIHGLYGLEAVFLACALAALAWLLLALPMEAPQKLSNYIYRAGHLTATDEALLATRLAACPGVAEVVVVVEEGLAYLKIDRASFDEAALPPVDDPVA